MGWINCGDVSPGLPAEGPDCLCLTSGVEAGSEVALKDVNTQ